MVKQHEFQGPCSRQRTIEALDAALIDEEWFDGFLIPANSEGLRRVVLDDVVYIMSNSADTDSCLLVVNIGQNGVFAGPGRKQPRFERILRVALPDLSHSDGP